MRVLDVLFSPSEAGARELRGKTILVADALCFASTALRALSLGATSIYPFQNLLELRSFAAARPGGRFLTLGSPGGQGIEELQAGSSPGALTAEACEGREILAVTENGTKALKLVENQGLVLLLSFNNLSACASFASRLQGGGAVLCAGSRGRFAGEDSLLAGAFVEELTRRDGEIELTEAARAARDLFRKSEAPLLDRLLASEEGKTLASGGRRADVEHCAGLDLAPLLPVFRGAPARISLIEAPPAGFAAEEGELGAAGTPQEGGSPDPEAGATTGQEAAPGPDRTRGAEKGLSKQADQAKKEVDEFRMPLGQHLEELRKRLVYCIAIALAAFVAVFSFSNRVMDFVLEPIQTAFDKIQEEAPREAAAASNPEKGDQGPEAKAEKDRPRIIALKPYEVFMNDMKVSFVIGLFLASPLIFWQLWLFISKALYPWERKWVYIFAPATYLSFTAGVLFLYFVVLPVGLQFLIGYGSHPDLMKTTGYEAYVSFFLTMALIMGLVFELPLVMIFIARLGLVHPRTFAAKRKYVIVGIFVVAALVTPPDVVTQVLVGVPLCLLYELGILLSWITYKARQDGRRKSEAGA